MIMRIVLRNKNNKDVGALPLVKWICFNGVNRYIVNQEKLTLDDLLELVYNAEKVVMKSTDSDDIEIII
jgi:hypothetical protein